MDVPVYNMQGEVVGELSIDEATLGGVVNPALIKQAYVRYHANLRQGSARTRSRGMTEGSTRKLYRQKGTGRARSGPSRTPLRRGGGVTFSKTKSRESYHQDMPNKMRRKANRNALLAKLVDNEVKVVDGFKVKTPKTKEFLALLTGCGIDRSCLLALDPAQRDERLAARNIDFVDVCPAHELTCFNMLNHRNLVISKEALLAWLEGASAHTGKGRRAEKEAKA